jgi:hypothetical protein
MNSFCFPVNGVGGFSLIFSEALVIVVAMVSAIVFPCIVVVKVLSVGVSGIRVSCQSIVVVSRYRGVRVSQCTVKIRVRLLVSLNFC